MNTAVTFSHIVFSLIVAGNVLEDNIRGNQSKIDAGVPGNRRRETVTVLNHRQVPTSECWSAPYPDRDFAARNVEMVLADCFVGNCIELKVPCRPEFVRTIRRAVADFAESLDMPREEVEELEIAASEAASNTVRHAFPDEMNRAQIKVRCSINRSTIMIEIIDRGCGFDAPADGITPDVDFEREGGLGIILIKSLMDDVNYFSMAKKGTRLRMKKRIVFASGAQIGSARERSPA